MTDLTLHFSPGASPHPAEPPLHRASAFDLVASTPWAILPSMLETISAIARRENDPLEAVEARLGRPLQNTRAVSLRGDVAVVPVTGPIFRYANLFTAVSGGTSLDVLATDFAAALDNPAVTSIVLNIDSPGGQAAGIAEFAQMVRAATKPVVAYVDGQAASAAYWIAAAADRIVMSKTAEVGSIGAVVSIDMARSKAGGVIEIVSSQSPKKRPDVATDEGRAQIQTRIDALAQVFVEDVAAYRGVPLASVLQEFGQGDMRIAAAAVALGMADSISTLELVIAGLTGTPSTTRPGGPPMTLTRESLAQDHPALVAALLDEGRAQGAQAERERIQAVEAQTMPGHEALITALKWDGQTSGAEAAVQVLAAERASLSTRAAAFVADAPPMVPHAAAPALGAEGPAADAGLPVEERCAARWERDEKVRSDFLSLDNYTAFERARAAGSVRILGKQAA